MQNVVPAIIWGAVGSILALALVWLGARTKIVFSLLGEKYKLAAILKQGGPPGVTVLREFLNNLDDARWGLWKSGIVSSQ